MRTSASPTPLARRNTCSPAPPPTPLARRNTCARSRPWQGLRIDDVLNFDFVSPPSTAALSGALEQLLALGAIDEQGELSAQVTRAMRTRERMHSLSMRLMRMRTRAARDDDTRVAPG